MRHVVLCISEMAPSLLQVWKSHLPNFAALINHGCSGTTRYSVPCLLTPQMWSTITTGVGAGHHGVIDYWQRDDDTGSFTETTGRDVVGRRFWELMDDGGVSTCIANVPHTYPPGKLHHGVVFSGQDAPGAHPSIAAPRSAYRTVCRSLGRYHHKDIFPGGQVRISYAATVPRETEWQARLFEFLVRHFDADFTMCYASGAAMAQHYFWADMDDTTAPRACRDAVFETYKALDSMLGKLRTAAGPDANVWVLSECGAGPLASGIDINCWLREAGFLCHRDPRATGQLRSWNRQLLEVARMGAQRFLPKRAFYFINRPAVRRFVQSRIGAYEIDWQRTSAYHLGKAEGSIYLNLRGREPFGTVTAEMAPAVLEAITSKLHELRDPSTREPVVAAVHRAEDLFHGPHVGRAPDLLIEWVNSAYMPAESGRSGTDVFLPRVREYMSWPTTGSHRPQGVFLAAGPDIHTGELSESVDLMNLAPTWLAAVGIAPSAEFQGAVVPEILKDRHPVVGSRRVS